MGDKADRLAEIEAREAWLLEVHGIQDIAERFERIEQRVAALERGETVTATATQRIGEAIDQQRRP